MSAGLSSRAAGPLTELELDDTAWWASITTPSPSDPGEGMARRGPSEPGAAISGVPAPAVPHLLPGGGSVPPRTPAAGSLPEETR